MRSPIFPTFTPPPLVLPHERYFATCARGLGKYLSAELDNLPNVRQLHVASSGVFFESTHPKPLHTGLLACDRLRTAMRVLYLLHTFMLPNTTYEASQSLYKAIQQSTDWKLLLREGRTFSVQARSSTILTSSAICVIAKNAICDIVRTSGMEKPLRPMSYGMADVPIFIVLHENEGKMYLDCGGESLHKRGYWQKKRQHAGLNETVAAAMLYELGMGIDGSWKKGGKIVDPMCGSGTLVVEGSMMNMKGWGRFRNFAIEKWGGVSIEQKENWVEGNVEWIANDVDEDMTRQLRDVTKRLGLNVEVRRGGVRELMLEDVGGVCCNPPWGRRMEGGWEELEEFLKRVDGKVVLLSGHKEGGFRGLKVEKKVPVRIGNVDCRILVYNVGRKWKSGREEEGEGGDGGKGGVVEEEGERQGGEVRNVRGKKKVMRKRQGKVGPIVHNF